MESGDGLLARLTPSGETIALPAFGELCAAARRHGNGIVEITSRGSIQVRGLTAASAEAFAAEVEALGIPAQEGIPVMPDPLYGLDETSLVDAGEIAGELRQALAATSLASKLSAKASVVVDGCGELHLDDVAADVRLRATLTERGIRFHVALGGTASTAVSIGAVPIGRGVECTVRLLERLAGFAPQRMRDAVASAGAATFASALAGVLERVRAPDARPRAEPVGVYALRSSAIVGIALAFGHSKAKTLDRLIGMADDAGATGLRTAPRHALLFVGMPVDAAIDFADRAPLLGFIADPADERRNVFACAGAPICASGEIPARDLASMVALAVRSTNAAGPIHVSGCAKGCAHPAPTPLTIIGRAGACDILCNGRLVSSVQAKSDVLFNEVKRLLSEESSR
jgi:precorrin-3B synthase